jgi:hypothetical protein
MNSGFRSVFHLPFTEKQKLENISYVALLRKFTFTLQTKNIVR